MSRLRFLLVALVATSVVASAVVAGFGWLLFDRQQALDASRAQTELDAAADTMAAAVRGRVAELGDRLSAWLAGTEAAPPHVDGTVVLARRANRFVVTALGGLPFLPEEPPSIPPNPAFAAGERLEFQTRNLQAAAEVYRSLARTTDPLVRAGALLRLGRTLRTAGDLRTALQTYGELIALGSLTTDGLPAALVGLDGQRRVLAALADVEGERRIGAQLAAALDSGSWPISRGIATYYRDGLTNIPKPEAWRIAEVVADAWPDVGTSRRGQRVLRLDDRGVVLVWRASGEDVVAAATLVEAFIQPAVPAAASWQFVDPAGRRIAGAEQMPSPHATRLVGSGDGSWELRLSAAPMPGSDGRAGLIVISTAALVFIWAATYLMARAITREARVNQLQSDFVAAVSHEFRSPLTTVRQMGEMLEMGRITDEPRRQRYYRAIVVEATRLQRLVEQVLDFRRLDGRDVQYALESIGVAALVELAVGDVQPQALERGTAIDIRPPADNLTVRADRDAVRLALRNLVENAVKYSPAGSTVTVRWHLEADHAAIDVADKGPGIARHEREAIFRRFVRGTAAKDGRVKGTGVGLAIVHHVASAHGGQIAVQEAAGGGSTFTLLLPLAEVPVDRPAHESAVDVVASSGH